MSDTFQTREDSDSTRSLAILLVMILVVLVTPLIVHTHNYIEIESITWRIRMEAAVPFRFSLTILRMLSLENYWPLYLFVFMVHRLYVGKTSFRRALMTGLFSGIYLPIVGNLGGIIYLITSPSAIGHVYFDTPTFIPVVVFFLLIRLMPYSKRASRLDEDEWLNVEE